jgi:hypothetical protein
MIVATLYLLVGTDCASTSSQPDAATTGDGSASPPTTSTGHHHIETTDWVAAYKRYVGGTPTGPSGPGGGAGSGVRA